MEFSLSGNALKAFARSIMCLSRVGNELTLQASPSQIVLHTLNSSRSAYESITFKPSFFDVYSVSGGSTQVQCSVLLKAVCSVLRTPIASIDRLSVHLLDPNAPKVQWTLECFTEINWRGIKRRKVTFGAQNQKSETVLAAGLAKIVADRQQRETLGKAQGCEVAVATIK